MFFKGIQLCIPRSSMRLNLIKKKHCGGLVGHFGSDTTLILVKDKYYWPHMYKDVQKVVRSCGVCEVLKGVSQNIRLYTPIFVPKKPLTDISKDFVLRLPKHLKDIILYLWWLIDFLKWLILYLIRRHLMLCKLLIFSLNRLSDCMDCLEVLFLIDIVSFLVIFG